jgi:hypothetical protein
LLDYAELNHLGGAMFSCAVCGTPGLVANSVCPNCHQKESTERSVTIIFGDTGPFDRRNDNQIFRGFEGGEELISGCPRCGLIDATQSVFAIVSQGTVHTTGWSNSYGTVHSPQYQHLANFSFDTSHTGVSQTALAQALIGPKAPSGARLATYLAYASIPIGVWLGFAVWPAQGVVESMIRSVFLIILLFIGIFFVSWPICSLALLGRKRAWQYEQAERMNSRYCFRCNWIFQ